MNKNEELNRLRAIKDMRDGLPHLYCFPFYRWQRNFWEAIAAFQFIYAANQIGKSSIMIRRMIDFCTDMDKWDQFIRRPRLAFYLYPDKHTIKREVETKWKEFLPTGEYEHHPQYGYKIKYEGNYPQQIEWNSGIIMVFRSYGGGAVKETAHRLQASSPAIIACDEELPEELWPELQMRISSPANAGAMFWLACTPTRGQKYLREIQEGTKKIPNSHVQTISMYDCLQYENNEKGIWTEKKIKEIEQTLPTQREIDVRVHGLFKPADGLAFPSFDETRNVKPSHHVKGWDLYCGIDYGIGGTSGGHPSSIVILAIKPDLTAARVIDCWRGDGPKHTTVDDVIDQYLKMCKRLGRSQIANTFYDYAAGEMGVIANNRGLNFMKANKDRKLGFNMLNSLFKNDMMIIYKDEHSHWEKLVDEIETYQIDSKKNDDLVDALRYSISDVVFDMQNIVVSEEQKKKLNPRKQGRVTIYPIEFEKEEDDWELEDEIDEWNELY